jgi:hypothetical protein
MDRYIDKFKNDAGLTVYFIAKTSCCGNYVEWHRGEEPEICPHCGDKHYKKPGLENRLFNLQDEFLADYAKTGSTKILGVKMFPLIQEYAVNMIKALIKGKKSLDSDELNNRAYDAATLFLEVILKDPEHRMKYSFGTYLGYICKSVCYSTKDHERTCSLNAMLRDGETELGEMITADFEDTSGGYEKGGQIHLNNVFEMADYQEDVTAKLLGLIEKTADMVYDTTGRYADKLLYMQGLLMKFKSDNDAVMAGFFESAGRTVRNYVEKGELVIFSYLRDDIL